MDESQISELRGALHRWIDQAAPEHLVYIDQEVQSILAGDRVAWSRVDVRSDRLAPEAQITAMMAGPGLSIAVNE